MNVNFSNSEVVDENARLAPELSIEHLHQWYSISEIIVPVSKLMLVAVIGSK